MNKTSILAISLVCFSTIALATDPTWLADFKKADLNDSGGLSLVELNKTKSSKLQPIKAGFSVIDADQDGQVTRNEYQAFVVASSKSSPPKDQCQPNCGVVLAVDRYKIKGDGSALGAIAGGVAGGLLGNQIGGGTGNTIATVGGAAGGAYIGHQLERRYKTKKMVKVKVKFDNGEQKDFDFEADKSPVAKGARVLIEEGKPVKYTGQ